METSTVMYTQLQPWSTVGTSPCMEKVSGSSIPIRVEDLYKTPRPHPWRPTLGYENIQVLPLQYQAITDQIVDPCYTPQGMSTKPIKFPNLVTGFSRNPGHAARAALYTRYTPCEWSQNKMRLGNETLSNHHNFDKLRDSTVRLMREAEELVKDGQKEAGRKLGERVTEIGFWERELSLELERLIRENGNLQECRRKLQQSIQDLEAPLHIAQECLYHRESRKGCELVHDEPEKSLLHEVEIIRNSITKLNQFSNKCVDQLTNSRAMQNRLEIDIGNKNTALGIDTMCQQMNNFSGGLQYYGGIEKYNSCVNDTENWAAASNEVVKSSQTTRKASQQLRADIETAINAIGQEIWEAWSQTNNSLSRRITETIEANQKIQAYLQNIQNDIFGVEKNMELLKKGITDKSAALKVAHTRLEARTHRPHMELCCDYANLNIIQEVKTIESLVHELHSRLQECEGQHQQLLRNRDHLETDLKGKTDALFIDREKCMGMRRSYPILNTVIY